MKENGDNRLFEKCRLVFTIRQNGTGFAIRDISRNHIWFPWNIFARKRVSLHSFIELLINEKVEEQAHHMVEFRSILLLKGLRSTLLCQVLCVSNGKRAGDLVEILN